MRQLTLIGVAMLSCATVCADNYKIVDTAQSKFFDNTNVISEPARGDLFYGQDAHHTGNAPSYRDNGDGTISDNVTGLMWQKGYTLMSYNEAMEAAKSSQLAGHNDWRVPTIKEAYSLILFSGCDVSPNLTPDSQIPGIPFVDTNYFDFKYGANGPRAIDSQLLSSTIYVGSTGRQQLIFGVNLADGRIKGYGNGRMGGAEKKFMVRFVRGAEYGVNQFVDNGNGTISDNATSLMWSKEDSQKGMNWQEALAYAQKMNSKKYLGHSDWRVPNAKELQSIVDYSRSPATSSSAAIDPIFSISKIKDESGAMDYPFFWSSTTHENSGRKRGGAAAYVTFGRCLGNMSNAQGGMRQGGGMSGGNGRPQQQSQQPQRNNQQQMGGRGNNNSSNNSTPNWVDIHGAGAQRSDPKSGDPSIYANGQGPQGDAIRINNYVRLVRDL